jgi:K+/H+ antiporter YhaU regulatory subunit KhtT
MVLCLSILVTRIATVALTHTGLSRQSAKFQARSAFTGVGFTTEESEKVVNHPIRRRILLLLMLLGNAGVVTSVSTLILSFIDIRGSMPLVWRIVLLVTGLVLLWGLAASKWVDRHLSESISRALKQHTQLDVRDYAGMLHLAGDYQVHEMRVEKDDWMADRALMDLNLTDEGIMVLGITRTDGTYIGAPKGPTMLRPEDSLILYGRSAAVEKLDRRKTGISGELDHVRSVEEQKKVQKKEAEIDPEAD